MDSSIKYKIVEKIIQTNDDTLLNEINALLGLSENDCWNELPDGVKQSINQAKQQLDNVEGIPHADVMAEVKKTYFQV